MNTNLKNGEISQDSLGKNSFVVYETFHNISKEQFRKL